MGGGTPSTNNDAYWDGDIDWYSPAELGEQVYADRSVRRITQAGYDSCSATLLPAGKTILFTSRAGIGNAAILRRSACTNQGFQSLVVNDDTDVYFVYSMTDRIKKFAEQNASGSTFLEISGKGLAAGEFAFPSKDEQTAIGSMFKQLDHLITLHQRKRCNGPFTHPLVWEQRKLGELARRVTRKNAEHESDLPLTISAQYGLVDQRTFFNSQVASKDMSGYYLLRKGEFAYNKSTSTDSPWGAIKQLVKYDKGCVSTLYICFELLEADPDYLVAYYETDRWHKAVQLVAAEGARNHGLLNISPDDFFETQLTLPMDKAEQECIGKYFSSLDNLITLHQ